MAWKMNYTDQWGENHPDSYWTIAQCNSTPRYTKTGMIEFYGYIDQDHAGKRVVGQKQYPISSSDYAELVQQAIPNPIPGGINTTEDLLMAGIYQWTKNKLDTDSRTKDGNGNPIMISFFDTAAMG